MFHYHCKNTAPHAKHEHDVQWPQNRFPVRYWCRGTPKPEADSDSAYVQE